MSIDPTAFLRTAPRILIGPGERAVVYDALNWGMPERRGDRSYDPVQIMWTPHKGQSPVDTETYGFSLEELAQTHDTLAVVIDDPLFTENPTRACREAIKLVEYAMTQLGYEFGENLL